MASSIPAPENIPTGKELLALERSARRDGSGLTPKDVQGAWLLDQVWPKGSARPASFSAALLRGLGAKLLIEGDGGALVLTNAVRLGLLELRFHGPGRLVGPRPLLQFHFERMELVLAGRILVGRALPEPQPRRLPFFALIARGPQGWLAARGRGGGLALWRLLSPPESGVQAP